MTMQASLPPAPAASSYPIRLEIDRPASQSRILSFPLFIGTFLRSILLIPHFFVLVFLGIIGNIVALIATVAILFTGRYPRGMFDFYVGVTRWGLNVGAYFVNLVDAYPPFSLEAREGYPVRFDVTYPESLSRFLNFPLGVAFLLLGVVHLHARPQNFVTSSTIKSLLAIPHYFVFIFLFVVGFFVVFLAQFAILFTGQFPGGMHSFMVGIGRWTARVGGYTNALTDKYPPFSLN